MPKFDANLTLMFNEVGFLDRFAAAAEAGYKGVEFQFPYVFAAEELAARLLGNGLAPVLHNLPAGGRERGWARRTETLYGLTRGPRGCN